MLELCPHVKEFTMLKPALDGKKIIVMLEHTVHDRDPDRIKACLNVINVMNCQVPIMDVHGVKINGISSFFDSGASLTGYGIERVPAYIQRECSPAPGECGIGMQVLHGDRLVEPLADRDAQGACKRIESIEHHDIPDVKINSERIDVQGFGRRKHDKVFKPRAILYGQRLGIATNASRHAA